MDEKKSNENGRTLSRPSFLKLLSSKDRLFTFFDLSKYSGYIPGVKG